MKTYTTLLMLLLLVSCNTTNNIFSLYVGRDGHEEASIFFHTRSSEYVYSYYFYPSEYSFREIGTYNMLNDTLILVPQTIIWEDSITEKYAPHFYTTYKNDSVISEKATKRLYLIYRKEIIDITKDYFYPNDSNAMSFYEHFPLRKVKAIKCNRQR